MRIIYGLILTVFIAGCSTPIENIMRDPHFTHHQEALDALEREYLDKKITYPEYLEKKKELENKYEAEVKEREEKMMPSNPDQSVVNTP